jgi:FkbM family methyltransferase
MKLSNSTPTRADIVSAYRLILLRDPDEVGLQHHLSLAEQGRLTLDRLVASFLDSMEYRAIAEEDIVTVDLGGVDVVVDRREPDFGKAISRNGSWEPHLLAVLKDALKPGDVFVDIGANVGVMSLFAAKAVGDKGRVIAFEPNASNVQMLLMGVAANRFEQRVRVYSIALSERAALFELRGSSNCYLGPLGSSGQLAQAVAGDDILGAEPRIDFVKIDIEGHEPFALAGLHRTLAKHQPAILCEFNPRCLKYHAGKEPRVFAEELFGLSDSIYAIEHSGRRNVVANADQLMDLWEARNQEAVQNKLLPYGMLHFDLLFKPEKPATS